MELIKFPSFENHTSRNFIQKAYNHIEGLNDKQYVISEKLHGGNMQVIITEEGVERATRKTLVRELKNGFYGEDKVFEKAEYVHLIDRFKTLIGTKYGKATIKKIHLYGELFGANINKGVDYGAEKQFKLFTKIRINGNFIPPSETFDLAMKVLGSNADIYFVPIIKVVDTLQEALDYDSKFDSTILGVEDNICEGVVIEPLNEVLYMPNGKIFVIKKKNSEFKEKATKGSGLYRETKELSKELVNAMMEYELYLVENRVKGIMSKDGLIQSNKEIGKYIGLVLEDAKKDFLVDNEDLFLAVEKKDRKQIFKNTGNIISPMLLQYL